MSRVLNLLLVHQGASMVDRLLEWWKSKAEREDILLAHGGTWQAFNSISFEQKILIDDMRLRTGDHPRERQSYTQVLARTSQWLRGRDFTHIYFAEFDHLPLVNNLAERLLSRLDEEKADVLAHSLRRVDGTGWHHYLYHAGDPRLHAYWKRESCRSDRRVILSMLGTGSFWTREAFEAVAATHEPFPIYLELYLPTRAHHLGFRVRDFGDQNRYVRNLGDMRSKIEEARRNGAWTIHPIKEPSADTHGVAHGKGSGAKIPCETA